MLLLIKKKFLKFHKINLGCGLDYKKDYLNIDINTIADIKKSALSLKLPHNHYSEILLKDVVEHLGYMGFFKTLCSLYLMLVPEGKIIIETPDFDKTINQYIAAKNMHQKENILCHFYGIEDKGMHHAFCYNIEFLNHILNKNGFQIIENIAVEKFPLRPNIRAIVGKVNTCFFQRRNSLARFVLSRTKLKIHYVDFPYFETILDCFLEAITPQKYDSFFKKYSCISPNLILIMMKHEKKILFDVVGKQNYNFFLRKLKKYSKINFFSRVAQNLPLKEKTSFQDLRTIVSTKIEKKMLIFPKKKMNFYKPDFFTKEQLDRFFRMCLALGIKKGDPDLITKAKNYFDFIL